MKTVKELKKGIHKKDKINFMLFMLVFIIIISFTVGYGALNQGLKISGEAVYRASADIRITNVSISEVKDGAAESYKYYGKNIINFGLDFPNNTSQISYKVDITNFSTMEHCISNIKINNPNIKYEIKLLDSGDNEQDFNIPVGNIVPKTNVIENAANTNNVTKTYKITFSYTGTVSDVPVIIEFEFTPVYTFKINPNPKDATVKIDEQVEKNVKVKKDAEVSYSVSKNNYATQSGKEIVKSDIEKNIDLVETAHNWSEWVTIKGKEPNCTNTGLATRTCSQCGAEDTKILPALGHNYVKTTIAPTYEQRGYDEYTCSRCGDKKEPVPTTERLYILHQPSSNNSTKVFPLEGKYGNESTNNSLNVVKDSSSSALSSKIPDSGYIYTTSNGSKNIFIRLFHQ